MRRRTIAAAGAFALAAILIGACGGSPANPGPVNPPPDGGGGGPTNPNSPPVISSIDVSNERTEVETEVTVTAHVTDAETAVDQLKYEWKAEAGTFSGEGASVKWRAPSDRPTPTDYTISLTVTETYGNPDASGNRPQNVVSGTSPAIRVHNSPKELGDMGLAFLRKFGDSSVAPELCVIDFSDSCGSNKEAELNDITDNRKHFLMLDFSLGNPRVGYTPGTNTADVRILSSFTSRTISCEGWSRPTACVLNSVGTATFDGYLPGVYEKGRWWICDSKALAPAGASTTMTSFFRAMTAR